MNKAEQYFRVNIYNDKSYGSDIEVSHSFEELTNAYEFFNKEVAQNKDVLVELILEVQQDEMTGTCYTLADNLEK